MSDEPAGGDAMEPEIQPQSAGSYRWLYSDAAGVATDGPGVAFDTQESAEGWLAENFDELADAGIDAVSLLDGSRVVYGPMPLDAG